MHNDFGLTPTQVAASRRQFGRNELSLHTVSAWRVLSRQLANPLFFILIGTVLISYLLGDTVNSAIIAGILLVSVLLGFVNEYSSERAVSALLKKVSLHTVVIRHGVKQGIPVSDVVVGDIVILHRGTVVPADLQLLETVNLAADESVLTGESVAVPKFVAGDAKQRRLYMGSVVVAGDGVGKVVAVARDTQYGRLMEGASQSKVLTAFQQGLADLSTGMTKIIAVMALGICIVNILLGRDPLQAVLFALAVAIGLTPALLPVIVTVCMARGAQRMAKRNVVIKHLVGIEDLGNMDVLCTDKTGTLTEGKINLTSYVTTNGRPSLAVLELALLCNTARYHHKVIGNPMDAAILAYSVEHQVGPDYRIKKVVEEEFNYDYRGQYCVAERGHKRQIVFKGAADAVLARCHTYTNEMGQVVPIGGRRGKLADQFEELNREGIRVLAVAMAPIEVKETYSVEDAKDLQLMGYLTFLDVPKPSAKRALENLKGLGVDVKILTGDNELVTRAICQQINLEVSGIMTGPELAKLNGRELAEAVMNNSIFARINPSQKEEVVNILKKAGKTVGFMGDGVNDVGALKAADVGISVNTAVDVAKSLASVVLLKSGLEVIADGVQEGRRIFANTIKYILMGASSNFGNMVSVSGASLFLPFLPMTPSQILLNNSLYDTSQLGLPSDEVDPETLARPHQWNMDTIYRYMVTFGSLSSAFDFLSFIILWFGFHGVAQAFQTGWFLESLATQVLVVFVIRSARPLLDSRPGKLLMGLCAAVLIIAFALPFTPVAEYLHLVVLPLWYHLVLIGLIAAYLGLTELVKVRFLRTATV